MCARALERMARAYNGLGFSVRGVGLQWRRLTASGNVPKGSFHKHPKVAVLTQQAPIVNLETFARNKKQGKLIPTLLIKILFK